MFYDPLFVKGLFGIWVVYTALILVLLHDWYSQNQRYRCYIRLGRVGEALTIIWLITLAIWLSFMWVVGIL